MGRTCWGLAGLLLLGALLACFGTARELSASTDVTLSAISDGSTTIQAGEWSGLPIFLSNIPYRAAESPQHIPISHLSICEADAPWRLLSRRIATRFD